MHIVSSGLTRQTKHVFLVVPPTPEAYLNVDGSLTVSIFSKKLEKKKSLKYDWTLYCSPYRIACSYRRSWTSHSTQSLLFLNFDFWIKSWEILNKFQDYAQSKTRIKSEDQNNSSFSQLPRQLPFNEYCMRVCSLNW